MAATEFAATELSVPALDSLTMEPTASGAAADGVLDPAVDPGPPGDPALGHIGRYALKRRLGQGGLGMVYEAWDPLLSRTVAVKTLQFDIETPQRVALDGLFINEARAAAGLNHPGIVTVFDAGLSAHGVYIAMERLRGRDLRQALAEGWRPEPAAAALLVRRLAEALAYAHAKGVVHCDVKPANIHLGRRERPKLLDFGIARVAHGASIAALEGLVCGSPHYLAPEQLDAGAVDARTDIYALGVVFYELLAGRKAFDGTALPQILEAVRLSVPPPPEALRPAVPPALSAIALRAMARDPAQRYASAGEMAQALRQWVALQGADGAADASTPAATSNAPSAPIPGAASRRWSPARLWPWGVGGLLLAAGAVALLPARAPDPATPPAPPAAQGAVATPVAAAAETPAEAPTDLAAEPTNLVDAAGALESAAASAPALATATTTPAAARPPRPRRRAAPVAEPPPVAAPVVHGLVQLAISPWGEIEVDGQPAGTAPPLNRLTLPEGPHTITVRNGDLPAHTLQVQVSGDKPVTVRHRFGP